MFRLTLYNGESSVRANFSAINYTRSGSIIAGKYNIMVCIKASLLSHEYKYNFLSSANKIVPVVRMDDYSALQTVSPCCVCVPLHRATHAVNVDG